jgi:hypothetical protein
MGEKNMFEKRKRKQKRKWIGRLCDTRALWRLAVEALVTAFASSHAASTLQPCISSFYVPIEVRVPRMNEAECYSILSPTMLESHRTVQQLILLSNSL